MTAFRQVITKLQERQRQEALIALDFVLRLDPHFVPGTALQKQLQSETGEVDLGEIVGLLQGTSVTDADGLLVEAVDDFNARSFVEAREKVQRVLMDIPGHAEARELLKQIDEALEKETLIGDLLARSRESLDGGDIQHSAELVMDAQALDPHHPGIQAALEELEEHRSRQPGPSPVGPADDAQDAGFTTIAGDADDLQFAFEPTVGDERAADPARTPAETAAAPAFDDDIDDRPGETAGASGDDFDPWSTAGDAEVSLGGGLDEKGAAGAEPGGEPLFEPGLGSDMADLFSEDSDSLDLSGVEEQPSGPETSEEVAELLAQGQSAFDRGDDQGAIDAWSRIYLVDPGNEEAAERIDRARQRSEDREQRLEAMVAEAREASERGETASALRILDEVLAERADHLDAVELKERLAGAPEPPAPAAGPSAPALPDLDESLFEEGPLEPAEEIGVERDEPRTTTPEPEARGTRRQVPWRLVAAAVGALVVILVGVWVGSQYLSSRSDDVDVAAVNRLLEQAEELYRSGRIEEAVHLLQQFTTSSELDQQRIDLRLKKYQEALAPPTPTPIPAAIGEAERLMERGQLLAAYAAVQSGLEAHPRDATLDQLRSEIARAEPQVASLHRAMTGGDWGVAASIAGDLAEEHPSDPEYAAALRRALFNASLAELRVYSLTGAEGYLRQLKRLEPGDEEVDRILDFIDKYKARPVDMQLKIFIGSLSPR